MKKLILITLSLFMFACSEETDKDETVNSDDLNPVYLDANGVTIKAKDWAAIGDTGVINGVLYTIVSKDFLKVENDLTRVCTSRITSMRGVFNNWIAIIPNQYSENFNQDISSWDVSNVTDMDYMFFEAKAFNQDLSNWDVSNVTTMSSMFSRAYAFNQDLSSWDVSSVTDMGGMFFNAISFNQDLSSWDVGNVTNYQSFSLNTTNWTLPKPNF